MLGVRGLCGGVAVFRVAAVNEIGVGDFSAPSANVRLPIKLAPPHAPSVPIVYVHDSFFALVHGYRYFDILIVAA